MKKVIIGLASAAALVGASIAMAGGPSPMAAPMPAHAATTTPFYVSGDVGYGVLDNKDTLTGKRFGGFTWAADLGYKVNPYFAVEGGVTQFLPKSETLANGAEKETVKLSGFNAFAKGILPINNQFDVFAKAGMMVLKIKEKAFLGGVKVASASKWKPVAAFGVGTAYNLTPVVALTAQGIMTIKHSVVPATYAGYAGVSYAFNV